MAPKAGLSRAAFAQRFKALLGDIPLNYVTKVSKAFKRITEVSPQHYRLPATG